MIRFFMKIMLILLYSSCVTEKETTNIKNIKPESAVAEQTIEISVILFSIQKTEKKFMLLAIIENETGIKSFSKGDTISLYPNFIRREGEDINTKSSENEHMTSLQNLEAGTSFKATVKIRGKDRHGLIMNWEG